MATLPKPKQESGRARQLQGKRFLQIYLNPGLKNRIGTCNAKDEDSLVSGQVFGTQAQPAGPALKHNSCFTELESEISMIPSPWMHRCHK
uniref:Uncharacterized protein n=1 Tax=Ditylenchus dipsaci TaxID=166011 RepID=A0A915EA14_9BILA